MPTAAADSAGVLDAYHILREIAASHDVTLLCFAPRDEQHTIADLEKICRQVVVLPAPASPGTLRSLFFTAGSFASPLPAIAQMCHSQEMIAAITHLLSKESFDLVHVEFTQMAHYIEHLRGIPAILDESDIAFLRRQRFTDTLGFYPKRKLLQWDTDKLKAYELGFCSKYQGILVRTEVDRKTLREEVPHATIEVIPPWVDLSFAQEIQAEAAGNDILFYGAMWRPVNDQAARYFIERIFPQVSAAVPKSRFIALGSRPSSHLQSMSSPRILVPGFVQDVSSYYGQAAVVVAPLLAGAGIKGKIIQAMACGKPVVTTSIGAEGIPATESDGLFLRDNPDEFADCIAKLLCKRKYLEFSECTREFVRRYYDWQSGMKRLQQLYSLVARSMDPNSVEVTRSNS